MIEVIGGDLYQWDISRAVRIKPEQGKQVQKANFSNTDIETARVATAVKDGDYYIADIPDELLKSDQKLTCYAVMIEPDEEKTIEQASFKVNRRNRPDDYDINASTELRSMCDDILGDVVGNTIFDKLAYMKDCLDILYQSPPIKLIEKSPPRLICNNQAHCETGSCLYDDMIERVCAVLEQCIEDFEMRIKNDEGDSAKLHAKMIERLETKLKELEAKELSQWEAQSNPDESQRMPAHIFKQLNEKLLKEKDEIQKALCNAYESMPEPVDYEEKIRKYKDALSALRDPDMDAQQKNRLLKSCIDRIDYNREKPELKRSTAKRITVNGKRIKKDGLKVGANWTETPIEIHVKLKV